MSRADIINECKRKMYDAIWLEIDKDPQRPAIARVDIKTKSCDICIWCDPTGNIATVTHKGSNRQSDRLTEAIENSLDFDEVLNDYYQECPEAADQYVTPLDAFDESRLDKLMNEFTNNF